MPMVYPRHPRRDREIEEMVAALAEGVLKKEEQKRLIDAVWNLEKLGSVTELMAQTGKRG